MPTVLVIDDEPIFREVMNDILSDEGYTVTEAEDGTQGIATAESQHFDVILIDINLPDIDGLDICKTLRQSESCANTPLLILTADSSNEIKQEAKEAGATGLMIKPIVRSKLLQTLSFFC